MVDEKDSDVEVTMNAKTADVAPVSFFSLFRSVLSTFKPVSPSSPAGTQPHTRLRLTLLA